MELFKMFTDEAAARPWLEEIRRPHGKIKAEVIERTDAATLAVLFRGNERLRDDDLVAPS